jgi:hypothetical protein
MPWAEVPVGDRRRDHGHGRRETRTVKALTDRTPGGLGFPHAEQAVRITRTRTVKGKTSRETAYLVVSLPAEHAQPDQLQDWVRLEWHIAYAVVTGEPDDRETVRRLTRRWIAPSGGRGSGGGDLGAARLTWTGNRKGTRPA